MAPDRASNPQGLGQSLSPIERHSLRTSQEDSNNGLVKRILFGLSALALTASVAHVALVPRDYVSLLEIHQPEAAAEYNRRPLCSDLSWFDQATTPYCR